MSAIQNYISELKSLYTELKRLNKAAHLIRQRIKDVEKNVIEYLKEKEQPGVKYQDMAIIIENKTKRVNKSKKDIEEDSLKILEENGINNAKEVLDEIIRARKGEEIDNEKIKIKNIKKK
jgi:ABC-type uncharacterized transport system fused permease/ATPase subunit